MGDFSNSGLELKTMLISLSQRKIISIMLEEEKKNISKFESFEVSANDFYHLYKILKHIDKLLDVKITKSMKRINGCNGTVI
jgi:hypothetical protein